MIISDVPTAENTEFYIKAKMNHPLVFDFPDLYFLLRIGSDNVQNVPKGV